MPCAVQSVDELRACGQILPDAVRLMDLAAQRRADPFNFVTLPYAPEAARGQPTLLAV